MGWGRTLLLGDIGTQLNVQDVENAVEQMRDEVQRNENLDAEQQENIQRLIQENHELKLYLATLLKLLVSKGVLKQEEIQATVQAIERD